MRCDKKFWIENISNLFCSFEIFPMKEMTIEEQMNSLTRVVIIIFLVLFLIDYKYDFLFFTVAILLIIFLYYAIKKFSKTYENYGPVETVLQPFEKVPWNTNTNNFIFTENTGSQNGCSVDAPKRSYLEIPPHNSNISLIDTNDSQLWCAPEIPIEKTIDYNQKLVGPQNPKTLVQPIIPAPIYDYQSFVPNDFVVPTFLNEQRRQELYQNGYTETNDDIQEDYDYLDYSYPTIDTACGYNSQNLNYNMPVNYNSNEIQRTKEMAQYNKNLFTIPLQPGLSTFSEVNQPYASMSNLGISMQQPFLPQTFDSSETGTDWDGIPNAAGQGTYVEQDPTQYKKLRPRSRPQEPSIPLRSNVYDPRYNGYGPNYRNYVEPMTGQPRFYYDDIDTQTQPNYITRNNIDFTQYGPQIGPASYQGHLNNMEIRNLANMTFSDSVIQQRTELQQRLMHKNSNREWQRRQMPISTANRARGGGGKSNSGGGYAGPRG